MNESSARLAAFAACACLLLSGCNGDGSGTPDPGDGPAFVATEPAILSLDSPTKDEDPSVLYASDGRLFVAWFSDRGANPDIYLASTVDGVAWTSPIRVTTSAHADYYPTLIQDGEGTFHLSWFRWEGFFRGHIWYNTSADGLTWDPGTEMQVTTTPDVDDWVPTITRASDGTLLVYFVSEARDTTNATNEIYMTALPPGATAWEDAVALAGINSPTEHDHLPCAARTGAELTLVWVRHDTTEAAPWLQHKSDLYVSTSDAGRTWSVPVQVTDDAGDVLHLFPSLTARLDGTFSLLWLSTRTGDPRVFELLLAAAAEYPQSIVEIAALPDGYSHHIAATSTPGVYLGAWVVGPDGSQDIYYRFFEK